MTQFCDVDENVNHVKLFSYLTLVHPRQEGTFFLSKFTGEKMENGPGHGHLQTEDGHDQA